MTVKITIIGLGKIGASIGLALANHKDQVTTTGHDKSPKVAQKAKDLGAVDQIHFNLPASVEGADIILLALPLDQVHDTLRYITQDAREGVVIMDTAPVKSALAGWVKELLPPKRHYVGLLPALNPAYLDDAGRGIDAAHADLFQHGLMGISSPSGTSGEAVKLAADLATLLGATAYFADMVELDGIMASAHLLPHLTAAALVNATINQPGWLDIRKVAGQPFASSTALVGSVEIASLSEAILQDQQNSMHVLDNLIAHLQALREAVAGQDKKSLASQLESARNGRETWLQERSKGNWLEVETGGQELPKASDIWKQQIGGLDKLFKPRGRGEKKPE